MDQGGMRPIKRKVSRIEVGRGQRVESAQIEAKCGQRAHVGADRRARGGGVDRQASRHLRAGVDRGGTPSTATVASTRGAAAVVAPPR
ncbi:hypothetical protein E2562_007971 [Oryza meyeriana var. granulata]|uniref:Uncharacterized protein n=1 Tax=Oryza meyeriana var. granulata TaxID=110450 RepID=A0A6G1DEZ9_9ORYZ|nr:hypothetical protein E2562_019166 [Oryza meyeriana var. granulata]KAF0911198.1 hypothetical protein E2562_007971 [Oryza meyeriana var. granulata]